jgi:hypothetical protein
MRYIYLIVFILGFSIAVEAQETKPLQVTDVSMRTLKCSESSTGKETRFQVQETLTELRFESSAHTGVSKLLISIEYGKYKAESEINNQGALALNAEDPKNYFIPSQYKDDERGVEYVHTESHFDEDKNQYPVEFMHLKAAIPDENLIKDEFGFAMSHFSLSLVLPEFRIQRSKTFSVSGYLDYSAISPKNERLDDLTMGLVVYDCSWETTKLGNSSFPPGP